MLLGRASDWMGIVLIGAGTIEKALIGLGEGKMATDALFGAGRIGTPGHFLFGRPKGLKLIPDAGLGTFWV